MSLFANLFKKILVQGVFFLLYNPPFVRQFQLQTTPLSCLLSTLTKPQGVLFCGALALMPMTFICDGHHPSSGMKAQGVTKLCLLGGPNKGTFGNIIENI